MILSVCLSVCLLFNTYSITHFVLFHRALSFFFLHNYLFFLSFNRHHPTSPSSPSLHLPFFSLSLLSLPSFPSFSPHLFYCPSFPSLLSFPFPSRCILTPNLPEFNRLVASAIKRYTTILNKLESNLELEKEPDKKKSKNSRQREEIGDLSSSVVLENISSNVFEEHSIEDVTKILAGLASNVEEEKVRYLSIAFGHVTILKKGTEHLLCSSL
jgi:hypothetical protein